MAKMNDYPSVDNTDEFTQEQKAAFLGSAMCIATGSKTAGGSKVTANIPLSDITPAVPTKLSDLTDDITVDAYDSTNEAPISGKGVADALSNLSIPAADGSTITNSSGTLSVSLPVTPLAANHADVGKVLTVAQNGDTDSLIWDVVQGGGGGLTPPENIGEWINTYDHTTLLKNYTQFGLESKDVQIQLDPVVVDGKYTSYKLRYCISEGSAGFASPAFGSGSIA